MTKTFDAAATATALLGARAQHRQLLATEIDVEAQTTAQAYAVQELVMQELGPIGAFKTSKTPDGEQLMAPIPAGVIRQSGATFADDELLQVGVELEIAFRLERELPPLDDATFARALRDNVVAVPVIEVVDTRLAFLDTSHPMMKLADNQSNGGLVIGQPIAHWQDVNLATPGHNFLVGEGVVSEGPDQGILAVERHREAKLVGPA